MADNATLDAIAQQLLDAYTSGNAIQPPREQEPALTVEDAYAIQQRQERAFEDQGQRVVGRKIGLTSLAMQEQLGVDSPDFGFFTDKQVYSSTAPIPTSQFLSPKVEPELGFKLGADLAADASFEDVVAAVASTHLAIEIIDSRVRDWDIKLVDTIADNASCGAIIIDDNPVDIPVEALTTVPAAMSIDGLEASAGVGEAVMGHPLKPLQWLAQTLGELGVPLRKSDIILTGSFCAAAPVVAGSTVEVDYGRYGTLTARFN